MVSVTLWGGVNEIGGNKILVEDGEDRLFLDFGMSFGKVGAYFDSFLKPRTRAALSDLLALGALPALDGIYRQDACALDGIEPLVRQHGYPDLWCAPVESYEAYLAKHGKPYVAGVVLTHAHLDHFGHIGYLDRRIPLYMTATTEAALRAIDAAAGASGLEGEVVHGKTYAPTLQKGGAFPGATKVRESQSWERPIRALAPRRPHRVPGTAFEVTLIPTDHSIPGAASVLVKARGKTIYYSGDVRFHGTMAHATKTLRETVAGLRPDLFLCEGTRVESDRSDSEADVRAQLSGDFQAASGLCMVDFAWKDTTRFETLQQVATATGRTLVVSHKLAYVLRKLHEAAPAEHRPVEAYDNVRVYLRRMDTLRYEMADYGRDSLRLGYWAGPWSERPENDPLGLVHWERGVRAPDIRRAPHRYILMLGQYEMQDLIDLQPPKGSTYIRAACEPFSDDMDLDLQRQANWLARFGLPVNDARGGARGAVPISIHASGHAGGPDILDFVRRVDARVVVPVHTEAPGRFRDAAKDVTEASVGVRIEV